MTDSDFEMALCDAMPELTRFARRYKDDAQDALQETYFRALRSRHTFDDSEGQPPMIGWLQTILKHIVFERARDKVGKVSVSIEESVQRLDTDETQTRGIDQDILQATAMPASQEQHIALFQAISQIGKLSLRQQTVMNAVVLGEMDYPEASKMLGIPVPNLKNTLSDARKALRDDRTVVGRKLKGE